MNTYLEIKVPISFGDAWLKQLSNCLGALSEERLPQRIAHLEDTTETDR